MKQFIVILAVFFVIISLLMYLFQRHLIYFPSKQRADLSAYPKLGQKEVILHTVDGLALHSWYKPAAMHEPTLLYLHGNAGNIGDRLFIAQQFINQGFGLLLLEYRGYGGNKGQPTEQGLYEDARSALRFLQDQGIDLKQIILYGESLGTAVATQIAIEHVFCAVILQAPLTSLADLTAYHYPWWFWIQPWDRFDSLSKINKIRASLLILHGKQDTIVPYSQGLQLFKQAIEPKAMVTFEEAGHSDLWSSDFIKAVIDFIKQNGAAHH